MVEIVLNMIPFCWVKITSTAGLEVKGKGYKELTEHLEKLKISLPENPQKKDKIKIHKSENDNIPRKDEEDKKNVRFYNKKPTISGSKSCGLYKMFKREDKPAWNIYNADKCCSKGYYKKRKCDPI